MVTNDDRDVIEVLKSELNFVEKGGYDRSVRTPRESTTIFQDSPTCLEFPTHSHEECCVLMKFVPAEFRSAAVPCHHIPLNEAGETLATLAGSDNQELMQDELKNWLKKTITSLEEQEEVVPVAEAR